jgi:hypothetical protein
MSKISDELYVCPDCLEKIKNSKPREYTVKETQEKLIRYLWGVLDYWLYESRATNTRDKMEGLLFTILSTLDGSSADIPGFQLIPYVGTGDKEHHIKFGENWYNDKEDIGGYLHELLERYGPTEEETQKRELQDTRKKKLERVETKTKK